MYGITNEEKKKLLVAEDIDTFHALCRDIYPNVPMGQMDLEVLKHMDKLCKQRGKAIGEDIQKPSDPREAFRR